MSKIKITNAPSGYCSLIVLLIWIYGVIAWIVNLFKFVTCDFDAPWKDEIIRAVGLFIPPCSMVTCWF